MSLGSAWSVGLSGLSTASDQMALVSRNVARAGDVSATRKVGEQVTTATGSVRLAVVGRVANPLLLEGLLSSRSNYAGESVTAAALDRLHLAVLDPKLDQSPAAFIAALDGSLRLLANDPTSQAAASELLGSAHSVAKSLNDATAIISAVRSDADRAIADSVTALNVTLRELEGVNREIVTAPAHADMTDQLDKRDALLKLVADHVGIRVVPRGANDISVYTDSGVTLFETVARKVTFNSSGVLGPGVTGHVVTIDGLDVTGPDALMPLRSGSIVAQIDVRDNIAPTFQTQMDELARGLIEAFSDPDRSGGGKPNLPGLFTWTGATVPPSGSAIAGLAARITVNSQIDPGRGGSLSYLRDGGSSAPGDPDYNANISGASGFSGRLFELVGNLSEERKFDSASGLRSRSSILDFSSESVGWIDARRQSSTNRLELRTIIRDRADQSLLSVTGVNLDQEMADLLRFEQSFQASSRLIATIDQMIETILEVAR
ncbi:MAG: flagellar hook-associated protein FlgK [Hyphomicrobium sp.]|mgnify:CR=1 FL=1|nr:flagellar hook-associated protein FlgK [Hyphomicrobium sp.]